MPTTKRRRPLSLKRKKHGPDHYLFISASDTQLFGVVAIVAFAGGIALTVFGPQYAPQLYDSFNNALGGIPGKIGGAIQGKGFYAYGQEEDCPNG